MKRVVVSLGIALWIALASLGSVAAQGSGGEDRLTENVTLNSVGIAIASAHTSDTEGSLQYTLSDVIVSKKPLPGAAEN